MKLVNLRASEESYERWKTAAAAEGKTWSEWVRVTLDEKALRGREREAVGTAGPSRPRSTRKKKPVPVGAMTASTGEKRSYTPDFKRPK